MKMLKRAAWLCVAGCCCAGLMLMGGERSQGGGQTYCPNQLYGQLNGIYLYGAFLQNADCAFPSLSLVSDTRIHEMGPCGTCPDPIVGASHPIPIEPTESSLIPQPDPRFGGVLR